MTHYACLDDIPPVLSFCDTPALYSFILLQESETAKRRFVFCIHGTRVYHQIVPEDVTSLLTPVFAFPFLVTSLERGAVSINDHLISLKRGRVVLSEEWRPRIGELLRTHFSDYTISIN